MATKTEKAKQGLKFKKVKVYFIYSFFLDISDEEDLLSGKLQLDGFKKGKYENRVGVPPNLLITTNEHYKLIMMIKK